MAQIETTVTAPAQDGHPDRLRSENTRLMSRCVRDPGSAGIKPAVGPTTRDSSWVCGASGVVVRRIYDVTTVSGAALHRRMTINLPRARHQIRQLGGGTPPNQRLALIEPCLPQIMAA